MYVYIYIYTYVYSVNYCYSLLWAHRPSGCLWQDTVGNTARGRFTVSRERHGTANSRSVSRSKDGLDDQCMRQGSAHQPRVARTDRAAALGWKGRLGTSHAKPCSHRRHRRCTHTYAGTPGSERSSGRVDAPLRRFMRREKQPSPFSALPQSGACEPVAVAALTAQRAGQSLS